MLKKLIIICIALSLVFLYGCGANESASVTIGSGNSKNSSLTTNKSSSKSSKTENHNHSYLSATCTEPMICETCGKTVGLPLDHNLSNVDCTTPQVCSRCGITVGEPLGHDYIDATCVFQETCSRCGNTKGNALGHDYVNAVCSRCGKTDPETLPVDLHKLYLIDSTEYEYKTGVFTDSFGNMYNEIYVYAWKNSKSVHNLEYKYSYFTGTIITPSETASDLTCIISIYVDDQIKYTLTNYTKTTGKVDFKVDVKNASTLSIVMNKSINSFSDVAIINAKLEK